MKTEHADVALLIAYGEAFNRHDVSALMSMMTDDCVFQTAGGPEIWGTRHVGAVAVRAAFNAVFTNFPDSRWTDAKHVVSGDRGLSEWTYFGTRVTDNARVEVNGCDVFTFREGKIAVKNTFRKDRPLNAGSTR